MSATEYAGWLDIGSREPLPGELVPFLLACLCAMVANLGGAKKKAGDFLPASWGAGNSEYKGELSKAQILALQQQAAAMAKVWQRKAAPK